MSFSVFEMHCVLTDLFWSQINCRLDKMYSLEVNHFCCKDSSCPSQKLSCDSSIGAFCPFVRFGLELLEYLQSAATNTWPRSRQGKDTPQGGTRLQRLQAITFLSRTKQREAHPRRQKQKSLSKRFEILTCSLCSLIKL